MTGLKVIVPAANHQVKAKADKIVGSTIRGVIDPLFPQERGVLPLDDVQSYGPIVNHSIVRVPYPRALLSPNVSPDQTVTPRDDRPESGYTLGPALKAIRAHPGLGQQAGLNKN